MTLRTSIAPHVRKETSVRRMMLDMILSLLLLMIIPITKYGYRVVVMGLLTALTCVLCEVLFSLVARTPIAITEFSPVVTGLLIALLMPVSVPLWLPVSAAIFAILVAKAPFGGTGRSIFNPAAAGIAFAYVCWHEQMFAYPDVSRTGVLPWFQDCSVSLVESPAAILKMGLRPEITPTNLILGAYPGPVGATTILVIIACGLFIFIKRTANWDVSVCFAASAAAVAWLFPRMVGTRAESVLFELTAGSLVFCAVFMVTEPSTGPRTRFGRCLYGILGGVLTMIFRRYGAYEQGACFAILLMNAFASLIDRTAWQITHRLTAVVKQWEVRHNGAD